MSMHKLVFSFAIEAEYEFGSELRICSSKRKRYDIAFRRDSPFRNLKMTKYE